MIELNEDQQQSFTDLVNFMLSPFDGIQRMVFKGAAGCGKTTTLNYLLSTEGRKYLDVKASLMGNNGFSVPINIWATTHKAVGLLKESLKSVIHTPVTTIHSALSLRMTRCSYTAKPILVRTTKTNQVKWALNNTIIFVDEASMWDDTLEKITNEVFDNINVKIVFTGDPDQLLGIDSTNYLNYYTKLGQTTTLSTPVRNSGDIYNLAHRYRKVLHGSSFPAEIFESNEIEYIEDFSDFINHYIAAFNSGLNVKALAWRRDHTNNLNNTIHSIINGTHELIPKQTLLSSAPLYTGNVCNCKNNEELVIEEILGESVVITEYGDIPVYILKLKGNMTFTAYKPKDMQKYKNTVKRAERDKNFTELMKLDSLLNAEMYYACTVHKSQGSTYDSVYINLNYIGINNRKDDFARLMYVAISRAKTKVIFTGDLPSKYVG